APRKEPPQGCARWWTLNVPARLTWPFHATSIPSAREGLHQDRPVATLHPRRDRALAPLVRVRCMGDSARAGQAVRDVDLADADAGGQGPRPAGARSCLR